MIDLANLRTKSIKELEEELTKFNTELENTVKVVQDGKEKNVSKIGFMKKDYARIATILKEKVIEENTND